MRYALRLAFTAALLTSAAAVACAQPPATRVQVVRDTLHGVVIEDPYRWLEDQSSAETRAWVRDQMAWTRAQLAQAPGREALVATLSRFSKVDNRSMPRVVAGQQFFTARKADQQQGMLVMKRTPDGPDEVLVDANPLSEDHSVSVSLVDVSRDGKWIAYGVRKGGEDEVEVRLLDVDTKQEAAPPMPRARYYGLTISPDRKGCWYGKWEKAGSRVWWHRFGDDPAADKAIFGEGKDPREIISPALSEDGKWLLVQSNTGSTGDQTKLWIRPAAGNGAFTVVSDTLHASLRANVAGDQIYLRTNWNAPNGRLMVADARKPGIAHWRELVPERKNAVLEGVSIVGGKLALRWLVNVSSQIEITALDGTLVSTVKLPGLGSATNVTGEWNGTEGWYSFSSLTRPQTIYRYDFTTGASTEWWRSPVPFDSDRYDLRQVWYISKDGTKVPMFVAAPKGIAFDGTHPTIMTGYGGFNLSQTPAFSPRAAAWLEMGGVYVLTCLRGGGEFGESWHRAGMLAKKQNTFDDFLYAAQWMLTHGYCTPEKLGIFGGSNGGLLVGAAMTQRPDLFGAVVCSVPLLDMLRYQNFLVARFWVPEYGSSEDPAQFPWLRAYSPYHHVKSGVKYPAVMFVSGNSDTRVAPLHARKMAALMQAQHGEQPVLLHYDAESGHSAGKGVDRGIEDLADELQFLRWRLGLATVAR